MFRVLGHVNNINSTKPGLRGCLYDKLPTYRPAHRLCPDADALSKASVKSAVEFLDFVHTHLVDDRS